MDEIFENVDFQVIFVVIAVIVAALQAFSEKRKKKKAEEELLDDVSRRVAERRDPAGDQHSDPAGGDDFGDLYEEYRRQIADNQRRPATEEESYTPPWQPPRAEELPPPLPPSLPPTPPEPTPVTEPSVPQWQAPEVRHAADRLSPAEQAALESLAERGSKKRTYRRGRSPSARQLLRDSNGRRKAIVLREILGPPKGQ